MLLLSLSQVEGSMVTWTPLKVTVVAAEEGCRFQIVNMFHTTKTTLAIWNQTRPLYAIPNPINPCSSSPALRYPLPISYSVAGPQPAHQAPGGALLGDSYPYLGFRWCHQTHPQ